MRWPLDHILVSPHFRHEQSGVGSGFGSDHFPSWAVLTYEPDLKDTQKPKEPTKADWVNAKKQLKKTGIDMLESIPDQIKNLK